MTSNNTLFDFIRGSYRPGWRERPGIAAVLIALYVGLGVFVNLTIHLWPKVDIPLPFSGNPPVLFPLWWGTVFVGLIFVLRDYGQRMFGDWVIVLTLIASIITYLFVDKSVAIYSASAFLVSEALDQLLFHKFGLQKLKDRILWSSLLSVWLDGVIILNGIGKWSLLNFASHWTGKMLASIAIWFVLVLLERRSQAVQLNPAE